MQEPTKIEGDFGNMTDDIPEVRTKHPYLMYEMLKETPKALKTTLKNVIDEDACNTETKEFPPS